MVIASIVIILIGTLIIYGGYSTLKNESTSFFAGNNEVFIPKNEKKLAGRIGWIVILFGVETMMFVVLFHLTNLVEGYHYVIVAVIHLFLVFVAMIIDQLVIEHE